MHLARLTVGLIGLGCGAGEALGPEATGNLLILTISHGSEDPDGFAVSINGEPGRAIGPADTLTAGELQPARYQLTLLGLAENCAVRGSNPQEAVIVAGLTTTILFEVDCLTAPPQVGRLEIIVATTGADPDQDGYALHVDSSSPDRMEVNDTLLIEAVLSGPHLVRLGGLAQNCTVGGENPDSISVAAGQTATILFQVGCWPRLSGTIAYSHGFDGAIGATIEVLDVARTGGSPVFFLTPPETSTLPAWSPDGSRLAYLGGSSDFFEVSVWVSSRDFTATELTGCQPTAARPVWSPDGLRILCRTEEGDLYSEAVTGGDVQPVAPSFHGVAAAAWASTGAIAFRVDHEEERRAEIYVMASPTAEPQQVLAYDSHARGTDAALLWSPDGTHLATVLEVPSPDIGGSSFGEVRVVDLATSQVTTVYRDIFTAFDVTWSPDGRTLAYKTDVIRRVGVDGQDARALVEGDSPAWSPDGSRLAFTRIEFVSGPGPISVVSRLFVMNADGTGVLQLTVGDAMDVTPAWAP